MDYGALEAELVGVLQAYFAANSLSAVFNARVMPENQVELLQDYTKGMCNVQYEDSSYADPSSTSIIEQEETVKVSMFLQVNNMKDPDSGGYLLIASVKKAFIGYQPTDARTRMWVSDYNSWHVEGGQLQPMIQFSFRTVNVQNLTDESETAYPIDSADSVNSGGPLVRVDEDLYELPDTTDVIGTVNELPGDI